MNDQEILTKAIEKAVANGWHPFGRDVDTGYILPNHKAPQLVDLVHSYDSGQSSFTVSVNDVVYSQDFAKALWGEELPYGLKYSDPPLVGNASHESEPVFEGAAWQYHLQQMVIADEPIAYLGGSLGLTLPPRLEVEPDGE